MNDWRSILVVIALIAVAVSAAAQDIVNQFDAPGFDSRGLAWDGQYLWCADAAKDSLFQIDPASGHVVHAIFFDFYLVPGGGEAKGAGNLVPALLQGNPICQGDFKLAGPVDTRPRTKVYRFRIPGDNPECTAGGNGGGIRVGGINTGFLIPPV